MSFVSFAAGLLALANMQNADTAIEAAMQTDRDFAAHAAEHGIAAAFHYYAAEDARLIQANSDDVVGREAILQSRANASGLLHWEPRGGYAGEAGDFAVTYGDWSYYPDGDRNADPVATGDYTSVWRLTPEGWRYVLDTGTVNTPPTASSEE
ncbi:nuclear transport factor 2 family protein [Hyphobacterium sp. HN65]|uniref:Nuclear transport factor 2 family protein n=1 Tax=Hyphobacterium lacteum TaxID=3116575 RepID=A0ABU7LQT5_9PROT|nr:nuclear transport factor 2 family protein [Hyphobacterium sp. HN65]MEE2526272.1 nuclear transport factor 2 family protein [Hyphobacterium sp. HN65]